MLILIFAVTEPKRVDGDDAPAAPLRLQEVKQLGADYWIVVTIGAVLMLAGFSEAFLVLRAQDIGLTLALIPLVFIVMNVIYALSAYPAGMLSDRFGRSGLIVAGFFVIIIADLVLAFAQNLWAVMAGVMLWGFYLGLTQGVLSALVADSAPMRLRGTAFGMFNLVSGIAMLLASAIAGLLWDRYGAPAPFIASAGFAALALIGWALYRLMRSESAAA